MAAPALSIVELSENERTVLLRANIAEGGDADLSSLVLADIANYAAVGPVAVALSINRVWWSLENMSVELKFEADTPVKALTLSGNGSYDFASISGIKNPGGAGSTGSILLDTYGIAINAAIGCVGSLIIEFHKVRAGEAGGELDAAATSSLFTPEVPEVSGGIIIGGNSTASGYIRFLEDTDNGSNYTELKAPAALAGNTSYTLPAAFGTTGQVLSATDAGVMSWVTVTSSGSIGTDIQAYSADLTDLSTKWDMAAATTPANLIFSEATNNGTNKVTIKAPAVLAADIDFVLPATDGDNLQFLQTNGSGVTSWATVTASGTGYVAPTTTVGSQLVCLEGTNNGTNKITIQTPATLVGDIVLTLPDNDGDNLQFLQTNGSGVTSWATVTASSTGYVAPTTTVGSQLVCLEGTDNGTNKVTIKTPASLAADIDFVLPATDGDNLQFLQTNGSGVTSWATVAADTHFTAPTTTVGEKVSLLEGTDNGTNKLILTANANMSGDVTLVFPANDGDASQVLTTNGSGALSWTTPAGGLTEYTSASASGAGSIYFAEDTDNGTNKVTIQAPATLAGDYTLTLPVDDGTASQVLTTNGSGVTSWTTPAVGAGGAGLTGRQIFTSNGTYTPTSGTTYVVVEVQGAGGGAGGVTASSGKCSAGGAGGGYARGYYAAPTPSQAITVGTGGTQGLYNQTGGTGGGSAYGSLIVSDGGYGSSPDSQEPKGGGTAAGGDFQVQGCPSTTGNVDAQYGGNGGASFLGNGGKGSYAAANGVDGGGYGGGGGGNYSTGANRSGSAGSPGIVIVWEYK